MSSDQAGCVDSLSLTLVGVPDAAWFDALRDEVRVACRAGTRRIRIGCDGLSRFDDSVARGLIGLLRAAREHGADVTLVVARDDLRERLRAYALDRIFTLAAGCEDAVTMQARSSGPAALRRATAGTLAVACALLATAAPHVAAEQLDPLAIVRGVVAQNAGMTSYRARVSVALHLRSFPFLSEHLAGTTYYKRPGSFAVDFDRVPRYAKGFDKLYSDIDDPSKWEARFTIAAAGERAVDGHRDVVLRMVQRVRGMIDHEDVAIDPAAQRIDEMAWYYYNGGVITMTQAYKDVAGYHVLAAQHAAIHIPFVSANADATYDDYRTNVAIDDSVFVAHNER